MPNATEAQIKNRIQEFVGELDKLVRLSALEAVHSVLSTDGIASRRGRPMGTARGPGRPKGSRRGRRPADLGDATAKIQEYVQANDGQGIGAIASATGLDLAVAKKAAGQLIATGGLKKTGQKRGTVYHVGSGGVPAKAGNTRGKKRGRKAK
jgi:hypothetical protein